MKILKLFTFLISIAFLFSCGGGDDNSAEARARKDVLNVIKELPTLKKEVDAHEEKLNAQELKGAFKAQFGDVSFDISDWSSVKSTVTFSNDNATFMLYTSDDRKEVISISISMVDSDLFTRLPSTEFQPTMYHLDFKDLETMKKKLKANILINYINKNTKERYSPFKGKMTLHALTENHLKISFEGEAAIGDYREKHFEPSNVELEFNYNYLTSDIRSK